MRVKTLVLILTAIVSLLAKVQAQFAITNNGDGTCAITAYTGPNGVAVSIPATIDGLLVTGIESRAFTDTVLTTVTISNNVTNIKNSAFWKSYVGTAIIGPSVTNIGDQAFAFCSVGKAFIGSGVVDIGEQAFWMCVDLQELVLGQNIKIIRENAFAFCKNLTSVTIPNSVATIASAAFQNCHALNSVTIGTGTIYIGGYAFGDCPSLNNVYFNGDAPRYGGDLFVDDNLKMLTTYYLPNTAGWSNTFWGFPNGPQALILTPVSAPLDFYPGLTVNGIVGSNYVVQSTVNLKDTKSWVTRTNLTLTRPSELWIDTSGVTTNPSNPQQFYRVLLGP